MLLRVSKAKTLSLISLGTTERIHLFKELSGGGGGGGGDFGTSVSFLSEAPGLW